MEVCEAEEPDEAPEPQLKIDIATFRAKLTIIVSKNRIK
jgi:hypothetical protein